MRQLTVRVRRSYSVEKIEILTVATRAARNSNEAMTAPMVGSSGV